MHIIRTHPHTGTLLEPIGYRADGSPIWPIMGASEDDAETDDDGDSDDADAAEVVDAADDSDDADGETDEDSEDAKDLGDAGKQAIERMKAKLKTERAKRQVAEKALSDKTGEGSDDAKTAEINAKANARILKSEVKAAAAGKLEDPADAHQFLDLDQFEVDDDGNVDEEEIADAIDDLIKKKPYLAAQGGRRFKGGADGGTRKESRPKQLTAADADRMTPEEIDKARKEGRFNQALGIKS